MLIETYKGIQIHHDAKKDEFFTHIVIRKSQSGKKDEFIGNARLQKTRDEIDKYLNVAAKKPVLRKAWLRNKYDNSFISVEIIYYNSIANSTRIRHSDGKEQDIIPSTYSSDAKLFISCKENDAIVKSINKASDDKKRIEREISCTSGKLIPLKAEHFAN